MAKRRRKKRVSVQFKSARVSMSDVELGWSGPAGGRTVRVKFRDGAGRKLGELEISAAAVRWWGPHDKLPLKVSSRKLNDVFRKWCEGYSKLRSWELKFEN